MSSEVVSHKCPNCGASLNFSAEDQAIKCTACDSVFTTEEMEKYTKALAEFEKLQENPKEEADIGWNSFEGSGDLVEGKKSYKCDVCGGTIIAEESVAATHCPYCDSPALIAEQLSGAFKPDVIIPFAIKRQEMAERLKGFLKGKFLVPSIFRKSSRIEESSGIYVPFWLYDAKVHADIIYHATKVTMYKTEEEEVVETMHFRCHRGADLDFENIPADASVSTKDEYMDNIEPFNFKALKSFDGLYMAGYMADRFTVNADDCLPRVEERIKNSCKTELAKTLIGYTTQVPVSVKISNREKGDIKYAMMPVWLMATRYHGKVYEFAMNGQTGKVVGNPPISKARVFAFWLFMTVIFTLLGILGLYIFG